MIEFCRILFFSTLKMRFRNIQIKRNGLLSWTTFNDMTIAGFRRLIFIAAAFFIFSSSSAQTVLVNENFSLDTMPANWSQDSAGVIPFYPWTFNNPGGRSVTGAGFDTSFAIFDSDHDGQNNSQDCYLNVQVVDASALTTVFLVMDEQYRSYGGQWHQVEVSNDNGNTWTHLLTDSTSDVGYPVAIHSTYNISSIAAGHSAVKVRFHFAAVWGWWWAIDNVKIADVEPCTSPPVAGQAFSSKQYPCVADSFSLSLINNTNGYGQSYQWQSSADGITWSDIAGATDSVFATIQSAAMYYRSAVTCSTFTAHSDSVLVEINPNMFCYCLPYNYVCTGADYISHVAIIGTALNDSSVCDSNFTTNYSYFAPAGNTTATLDAGSTYDLVVTTNNVDIVSVWIDYNRNGVFDANEWTQVDTATAAGIADTVSIAIPSSAINGLTGMRIRSRSVGNENNASSACALMGSGETEDYIITIDNGNGIQEAALQDISVFPSPSTGDIQINFGHAVVEKASITIFDLPGNILKEETIHHSGTAHLSLSGFANGIYFIRIASGNDIKVDKIILDH